MFDKLKQIAQLREMQSAIKKQRVIAEREGVKVEISGDMTIESVVLNPALSTERQAALVKELFNEAAKKIQGEIAKRFAGLI